MTVETVAGLASRFPWMSVRVIHQLAAERRIPHRKLPRQRALLFMVEEVERWIDNPALELDVTELDGGGRIVKPKEQQ